jgi:hypothetical protein
MAFRLPSVEEMLRSAAETYFRFPLTIICTVLFTVSALVLIEGDNTWMQRLIFTAVLGTTLFMALESYTGLNPAAVWKRWTIIAAASGFLLFFGITFPGSLTNIPEVHIIRFAVLLAASVFLASYLPFLHSDDLSLFWQYNKILLLRIVTTVPFTLILFAGLSIALASVENLFAVDVDPKWYQRIWVVVAGIFNTWFFLGGMPRSMQEVKDRDDYPRPLKLFTVNILLPLVLIYVVILYIYGGKIIMEWDWPKGWVGYLVLGFSITGILSLLLVWPMRNDPAMRWIRTFNRSFYIALMPLSVLLMLALWRRIDEYGLTENRYYVAILGVWLLLIALYFTFSAAKNIKWIPMSLSVIALFSAYGPWSAFTVSENVQQSRLETLINRNGLNAESSMEGKIRSIPFTDNKEICEIIRYLSDHFGSASVMTVVPSVGQMNIEHDRNAVAKTAAAALGIPYIGPWQTDFAEVIQQYVQEEGSSVNISLYDELIDDIHLSKKDSVSVISVNGRKMILELFPDSLTISVKYHDSSGSDFSMDLNGLLDRLPAPHNSGKGETIRVPNSEMTAIAEVNGKQAAIIIDHITVGQKPRSINDITFDMLIGEPSPAGR